jgi:protein-S-isoprenylcysteine O-methyltransferase Ste14
MTPGFFAIISSMIVYGLVHSILASHTVKHLAERALGGWVNRVYRLFFSAMAVLTFLPVLALLARMPDAGIYTLTAPWLYLTVAIQMLSAVGMLAAVWQTGFLSFVGFTDLLADPAATKSILVTAGFYRWMRHPIYTFSLLFLWLVPYMTWNILALNIGVTGYFVVGTIFEERKLRHEFGQAYDVYARRTPRFIPGIKIL